MDVISEKEVNLEWIGGSVISFSNIRHDLLDVSKDIIGRPFCTDTLCPELDGHRSSLGVKVLDSLDNRLFCVVKIVPNCKRIDVKIFKSYLIDLSAICQIYLDKSLDLRTESLASKKITAVGVQISLANASAWAMSIGKPSITNPYGKTKHFSWTFYLLLLESRYLCILFLDHCLRQDIIYNLIRHGFSTINAKINWSTTTIGHLIINMSSSSPERKIWNQNFCHLAIILYSCIPRLDPDMTSDLKRSPDEMWVNPYFIWILSHCVPFPDPGPPEIWVRFLMVFID